MYTSLILIIIYHLSSTRCGTNTLILLDVCMSAVMVCMYIYAVIELGRKNYIFL